MALATYLGSTTTPSESMCAFFRLYYYISRIYRAVCKACKQMAAKMSDGDKIWNASESLCVHINSFILPARIFLFEMNLLNFC